MTPCGCNRAVAALCALFAALAACMALAVAGCRSAGGRVSDAAWICEVGARESASLWTLVSPGAAALAALAIGVPVYFMAEALGRRLIAACGLAGR